MIPGTHVGPYRVERQLGVGGMGAVFAATDTTLDRTVALKVIAPHLAGDERFRRRFLLESKLAARLDHPAIVPVYFAGESDGGLYLAMRFVDGASLADLLERDGRLTAEQAVRVLAPIADALDAAHAAGLVHRDVKPGNILLEPAAPDGRPFLCDFGLARASTSPDSLSREDGLRVSGTMAYLAPEQIEGDTVSGQTDQYALTCVLYEVLSGRPPYQRGDELAVVYAHLSEPPPSLCALRPELPAAIDAVIAQGLAKQPADRYLTCTALLDAAADALRADRRHHDAAGQPAVAPDRTFLLASLRGVDDYRARHGDDAASALLRRFANAVANATAIHDGLVIEVRGEEAAAAFDTAAVAIEAAIAIRSATDLADGVGIGLDAGDAVATRLAARARAGEILGTEAVVHTAGSVGGATWHDLGTERVPGLAVALHLYAIHPARAASRPRRTRRRAALIAGVAVLTGVAAIVILATQRGGGGTAAAPPQQPGGALAVVGGIDPATGARAAAFPTGTTPNGIAYSDDSVWVVNADDKTVSQIDAATGASHTIGNLDVPIAISAGLGAVWVATGRTAGAIDRIVKIDPATGRITTTFAVPKSGGSGFWGQDVLAAGAGAVWIANADGAVVRIDPVTGRARTVPSIFARAVTADATAVVAVGQRELWRIDPATATVAENVHVETAAFSGLAAAALDVGGGIWALDERGGKVWHITPGPVRDASTIAGGQFGRIAYADGHVWLTDAVDQTLSEIAATTGRVAQTTRLAMTPQSLAVGGGRVWVAGTVARRGAANVPAPCGKLETAAGTTPRFVITSDLPLQATLGGLQMADAIRSVLAAHGYRAGRYTLGYQSCDSSTPLHDFDQVKCLANARAYAATPAVIGVIGSYFSDCTKLELPILNTTATGQLAMISPTNTLDELTSSTAGSGTQPGFSLQYYPTGQRNYARLLGGDAAQANAFATFLVKGGTRRVLIAHSSSDFGRTWAPKLTAAARAAGLDVVATVGWDGTPASARAAAAAARGADGVMLAAFADDPGTARAVGAIRKAAPSATLVATDGFTSIDWTLENLGRVVTGIFVGTTGLPNDQLPAAGKAFVESFGARVKAPVVPFATVYAAQAAEVLLDAIARSDGSRLSVSREMIATRITDGLIGSFGFSGSGDIDPATFSFYRITATKPTGGNGTFDGATFTTSVTVPAASKCVGC